MAKKKKIKKQSLIKVVKIDMKALRKDVIDQIKQLMDDKDIMEFEMVFNRQEGMEFKALKDSKVSKFIHGVSVFDENGKLVGNTMEVPSNDDSDGFPQSLYDMFDNMDLKKLK